MRTAFHHVIGICKGVEIGYHWLTMEEHHRSELVEVLTDLKQQIRRQTSFRFIFARGIVYGLGTVIGASVLIALLTWLLGAFFTEPTDAPLIGPALEEVRDS